MHPGSLVGVFNVRILNFLSVCLSWTLLRLYWVLTGLTPGWACAPLLELAVLRFIYSNTVLFIQRCFFFSPSLIYQDDDPNVPQISFFHRFVCLHQVLLLLLLLLIVLLILLLHVSLSSYFYYLYYLYPLVIIMVISLSICIYYFLFIYLFIAFNIAISVGSFSIVFIYLCVLFS